ncbi:MAG: hypothetical protein QHC67_03745 [Sphingobium sp.]|uniref:hypothetical protein n=1 Tax=Sphingobium sp. TaxID=1912891 RepID=UPI0029A64242|nr:hypothetical protein [Sphingobium sp.]MDX3908912.1 hypothetical protein [Sphingobium sp.]
MTVSTKMPIPFPKRALALNIGTFQAPLLFLAVAALYAATISTTPVRVDEYYTLFAARNWAEHSNFAILDGEYTRARLFTIMVGATFDLFGSGSLLIARVPSVLLAAGVVTLLYVWVARHADRTAATVAALLLALSGYTLDVAHFARFYAPQALVVLGAAILVHAAAAKAGSAMAIRLAGAVALLALGYHLQPTTLIAAAALAAWFGIERFDVIKASALRWPWAAAAVSVLIVSFMLLLFPHLMQRFQSASVWAQDHASDRLFYLREFSRQIPLILILLPIAAVLAVIQDRRLALLGILMVAVTLLAHSFAAMKAGRYVYYAMPFVALLFGLALTRPVQAAVTALKRAFRSLGVGPETSAVFAVAVLLAVGLATLLLNSSYRHTAAALRESITAFRGSGYLAQPADPIWDEQAQALRAAVRSDDFLVASDDLRTIEHIRPHDMLINASHLSDLNTSKDFTRDVRTGRPILGSVAGLDRLIDCRADGLIVVDDAHWRTAKGVPPAVADRIEQRTSPVQSPVNHFRLFRWHHRPSTSCPWASVAGGAA